MEIIIHIIICYIIDYDPVRFIYPEGDTTLVFSNVDSKSVECSTTGSLKPNMTWTDASFKPLDVVVRVHVVEIPTTTPPYVVQLNIISPVPYLDAGEYVCVVKNEWEVINRSVAIVFELLREGCKLIFKNFE